MKISIIAVIIMAFVLMSGHININFQHNLHLPKELTNKTTLHSGGGWFSKQTDIYLNDTMESAHSFRDVLRLLDTAKNGDKVVFHISGIGGQVDVGLLLINKVKTTKAHVTMIVEAPSYSGHAFLALSGHELIMLPYTYLLLHTSSGWGFDCSSRKGIDRGETKESVCMNYLANHIQNLNKMIDELEYLTMWEKFQIQIGKTIYITADMIKQRVQ